MPSVPLGLPTSDGCGRAPALLPVFGEYRNVLGAELPGVKLCEDDPENELGRCEPMLDPWPNDGLGALNEGRDGAIWKDLDGPELGGLEGIVGADLDGLLNEEPCQL
jgi:hypothetical protein